MLDEHLQRFSETNRQFSSRELVDTYNYVKGFLSKGIAESPIDAKQYREDNYFQIKALEALMTTLIRGWK